MEIQNKKKELIIFNFSDIYREETFYKHEKVNWIDCSDIEGTNCYCDSEAAQKIKLRMNSLSANGIHFIDSGNYHYVSKFFIDKIEEDFILVVFDHHPDMQPSLFDELLTCGSWVKAAIDTNQHLKKVVLVGTSDQLLDKIDQTYLKHIIEFKESQLKDYQMWKRFYELHFDLPIYISIDKDVLSPIEEHTNWDQGKATLYELKRLLLILLKHDSVIGIDICGACNYSIKGLLDTNIRQDDEINLQLARLFEQKY